MTRVVIDFETGEVLSETVEPSPEDIDPTKAIIGPLLNYMRKEGLLR